jgi:uncharacterized protein YbjQ (UPF0145 family)
LSVGFFSPGKDEDGEPADSEAGKVPSARLEALAVDGSLFTSGLSVNEFALLRRLGPQPLAQVMGASVVRPGWQYLPALDPGIAFVSPATRYGAGPSVSGWALQNRYTEASMSQVRNYRWRAEVVCELDTLTGAWNMARRRALDRLTEEALQVGADAVVGVHLRRSDHDLGKGTIEYVVTGTAIRLPNSAGTSSPTLTDVSVQDYWRLHSAGHEPVGLVATTAVMFASPPRSTRLQRLRTTSQNQELDELSQAFRAGREVVRTGLRGQVAEVGGTDAVGVEFSHSVQHEKFALASSLQSSELRGWHRGRLGLPYRVSGRGDVERSGWMITMHAAGTAVRRHQGIAQHAVKTAIRMGTA